MFYRAIGIMSGSSLDGLDICFAELDEAGGKWTYSIRASSCIPYSREWQQKLQNATGLPAREYMRLHTEYGHYIGEQVNSFIALHNLQHQVQLIASHGHTSFHEPQHRMTGQLGDGAAIAAITGINVVSDLRAMDLALGGQGAPIVPIGENLLLGNYQYFLNLGGIANISAVIEDDRIAFDVCPANRVLNLLINEIGHDYDDQGAMAASGKVHAALLQSLDELDFYTLPFPKSLANDFGTEVILPLIQAANISVPDALRTYTEHVAIQISRAISRLSALKALIPGESRMLVCGGGAFNSFQVERIQSLLSPLQVTVVVPDATLVAYKEALVMALIGVLRWREEPNVLSSVTGASRSSIGGAVWIGQE